MTREVVTVEPRAAGAATRKARPSPSHPRAERPQANGTPVENPGWQDVAGIFESFTSQMMWRLNLGSYDDGAANAQIILLRIGMDMPPPPFPPLTAAQIQTFTTWVNNGCPEVPAAANPPAVAATAPTPSTRRVRFR